MSGIDAASLGGRLLAGKTAVITGATAGIGEATAHLFADHGARLVLVARRAEAGGALVARLGPERAAFVAGDVADERTAEAAIAVADRWGGIDVLVNNAGIDHNAALLGTSLADLRRLLETNVVGAFAMLVAAARAMARRGGSIVNVSSRTASVGVPGMAAYGATKGALESLARAAAVEWASAGIRVNVVAPGLTETPMVQTWIDAQPDPGAFRAQLAGTIPQRRFARPAEVAAAILYLACDASAHVTGAVLPVDGGYTAA